jgi:hypothetical protein
VYLNVAGIEFDTDTFEVSTWTGRHGNDDYYDRATFEPKEFFDLLLRAAKAEGSSETGNAVKEAIGLPRTSPDLNDVKHAILRRQVETRSTGKRYSYAS